MIEKSAASESDRRTTHEKRGIVMFGERGDEIEHLRGCSWLMPSCAGHASYVVELANEGCECPDLERPGRPYKHVYAARIARAKSGERTECGRKIRLRQLHEVVGDDLTFFERDRLCESCAKAHGVL